jgi:hypothetical protein
MSEEKELAEAYHVRCWQSVVQEIEHDGGQRGKPLLKAAVAVVIRNPFAGKYVADLSPLTKPSAVLGHALGRRAVALLGGRSAHSMEKAVSPASAANRSTSSPASRRFSVMRCVRRLAADKRGFRPYRRRHPPGQQSTFRSRTRTSFISARTTMRSRFRCRTDRVPMNC